MPSPCGKKRFYTLSVSTIWKRCNNCEQCPLRVSTSSSTRQMTENRGTNNPLTLRSTQGFVQMQTILIEDPQTCTRELPLSGSHNLFHSCKNKAWHQREREREREREWKPVREIRERERERDGLILFIHLWSRQKFWCLSEALLSCVQIQRETDKGGEGGGGGRERERERQTDSLHLFIAKHPRNMLVHLREDLFRQLYVLLNWDRSCRSNLLSHQATVYWHQANQSQWWPCNARRLAR